MRIIKITKPGDVIKAQGILNRIRRRVPEMTSQAMMTWGKILERDMKMAARNAGIQPFTGTLYNKGIEWRQRPKGRTGELVIRSYGVALDTMSPHAVKVTKTRKKLLRWVMMKGTQSMKLKALRVASKRLDSFIIYVKPHPFITDGWNRARPKLNPILKSYVSIAVNQ